ncbi:hypothetical protein [Marinobacter sp.]|uniref:hypothetical protein n=1 Tax=Marinobacter sp. TaxID=50741 RepID=UPI003A92EA40
MSRLPRKDSVNGQVLRLMLDGKARTKLDITRALGLHPAKEVTARLRDYRKDAPEGYCLDVPQWTEKRNGVLVYVYRIDNPPQWMLDELAKEQQEVAA